MTYFTEVVIDIIKNIPKGMVMTYGQIATYASSPRSSRQVARILHSMSSKYNLPWYRVINSKGQIAFNNEEFRDEQIKLLENEGVEVENGIINLSKYQWHAY